MLKLKCQHFGHLMLRADSFEKTSMLEKVEGRRRRGWQRMRGWMASPTQWTWVWVDAGSWWWTGRPGVLRFMGSQGIRHDWATELNCTDIYANSQVECRSLVFTPNVLVFDGSFHPCFTISQQNSTWATVWFMSSSFLLSPWFTWAYGFRIT